MGGACSAFEGEESCLHGFGGETLVERYNLEDPDKDGRIILRWIFRKWDVRGMDWIDLTQDRDRWRAFVNVVTRLPPDGCW